MCKSKYGNNLSVLFLKFLEVIQINGSGNVPVSNWWNAYKNTNKVYW